MIVNYNTNITLTGKLPRISMMLAPVNRNQAGPFNQVFKYKFTYSKTWYPIITLEASQNQLYNKGFYLAKTCFVVFILIQ